MNYQEAVQYLDSFIDYEKIGYKSREPFKLERMRHLAQIFGSPQDSFPSIHITGTKGKGSTASFVSSILKEAGLTVGLYTSPHLESPRERIRVNNEMIKEGEFALYVSEIKERFEKEGLGFSPTFFEIYTLLAFNYFKANSIDYGVIEVGLGGRLDATNIVRPEICAISPISYDHTHILGNSLEEIAFEKSGIIKKGCIVVSAPQEKSALGLIQNRCTSLGVELVLVGKDIGFEEIYHDAEKEIFNIHGMLKSYEDCTSFLLGQHQIVNAACAVGIVEILKKRGAKIRDEDIKNGIAKTKNPGRCDVIATSPYIILDGAQNRASARALNETIKRNFKFGRLILILGISKQKDIEGIVKELVSSASIVILTKAKIERVEEPSIIATFVKGKDLILTGSVPEAIERARALATTEDLILVTGSFFVIGEVWTTQSLQYRHQ